MWLKTGWRIILRKLDTNFLGNVSNMVNITAAILKSNTIAYTADKLDMISNKTCRHITRKSWIFRLSLQIQWCEHLSKSLSFMCSEFIWLWSGGFGKTQNKTEGNYDSNDPKYFFWRSLRIENSDVIVSQRRSSNRCLRIVAKMMLFKWFSLVRALSSP